MWLAVQALRRELDARGAEDARVVIYSGDVGVPESAMLDKARDRFGVDLRGLRVEVVFFSSRWVLEAAMYPVLTMLGQSAGGMLCAAECVLRCPPDLFIDTMGAAFTYPVAALLAGSAVACYTHYPTITPEMTRVVAERRGAHNNAAASRSWALTQAKLAYYALFARAYAACGSFTSAVMANSSWTAGHLTALWRPRDCATEAVPAPAAARGSASLGGRGGCGRALCFCCRAVFGLCTCDECESPPIVTVYPPCNSELLSELPLELASDGGRRRGRRRPWVLSVGQFRPEKDHSLQLRAFRRALDLTAGEEWAAEVRLVLVGGARGAADEARVASLRAEAEALGIGERVEWRVNAPFEGPKSLREGLAQCAAGLHCMWNEHFGISVVESQAAGCVIVAHDSGGPRMDIVVPVDGERTGCRARSETGFAAALAAVLRASQSGRALYTPTEEAAEGGDEAEAAATASEEVLDFARVQSAGRRGAMRFADATFGRDFCAALRPALALVRGLPHERRD